MRLSATAGRQPCPREDGRCAALASFRDTKPSHPVAAMTAPVLHLSAWLLVLGFAPAGVCAAQSLPTTAAGRFESLDTNRDGVVSKYEYDSDAAFASMDSDHNNRVSAAELEAIMGAGGLSAADRIRHADRNEDGELCD